MNKPDFVGGNISSAADIAAGASKEEQSSTSKAGEVYEHQSIQWLMAQLAPQSPTHESSQSPNETQPSTADNVPAEGLQESPDDTRRQRRIKARLAMQLADQIQESDESAPGRVEAEPRDSVAVVEADKPSERREHIADATARHQERRARRYRARLAAMQLRAQNRELLSANITDYSGGDGSSQPQRGRDITNRHVGANPLIADQALQSVLIPPLPKPRMRRHYGIFLTFIVCVVVPFIAIAIYYLHYASDQYVAEFKFVVRDAKSAATGVTTGGVSAAGSTGTDSTSSGPPEDYLVADYITSRDAVDALQSRIDVIHLYSYPGIDWFSRFDPSQPIEQFMAHWRRMVSASYDQVTGIGTAQIRAFTPEDAYRIASTLLTLSEDLINKLANKPRLDAIKFAEADLKRAEDRLKASRKAVTAFRNKEQVIDPQSSIVTSNVQLDQTLRATLNQQQTDLRSLRVRQLGASSRMVQDLEARISGTRQQLAAVEAEIGQYREGSRTLSGVVGEFEQLQLEQQFAQNMVQSQMQTLEQVRSSALQQSMYVTAFVTPAIPQSSTYPRRIISICAAGFVLLLGWMFGLLIVRSMMEHLT